MAQRNEPDFQRDITNIEISAELLRRAIERLKAEVQKAKKPELTAEGKRLMILEQAKEFLNKDGVTIDRYEVENGMINEPDPMGGWGSMRHRTSGLSEFTIKGHYFRKPKEETK